MTTETLTVAWHKAVADRAAELVQAENCSPLSAIVRAESEVPEPQAAEPAEPTDLEPTAVPTPPAEPAIPAATPTPPARDDRLRLETYQTLGSSIGGWMEAVLRVHIADKQRVMAPAQETAEKQLQE